MLFVLCWFFWSYTHFLFDIAFSHFPTSEGVDLAARSLWYTSAMQAPAAGRALWCSLEKQSAGFSMAAMPT